MGVSRAERVLSVSFESAEAFEREYVANLVNGGVFVASDEFLDLRVRVQVNLLLRFCGKQIGFAGEVYAADFGADRSCYRFDLHCT